MAQERVHLAVLSLGSDGAIDQCCSEIVSMYHTVDISSGDSSLLI